MKYFFSLHFKQIYKKLNFYEKEEAKRAISELAALFDSGIKSKGLGLRRMRGNVWEIRVSISDRILFSLEGNEIFFLIIGNHDEVRRFLKNY